MAKDERDCVVTRRIADGPDQAQEARISRTGVNQVPQSVGKCVYFFDANARNMDFQSVRPAELDSAAKRKHSR